MLLNYCLWCENIILILKLNIFLNLSVHNLCRATWVPPWFIPSGIARKFAYNLPLSPLRIVLCMTLNFSFWSSYLAYFLIFQFFKNPGIPSSCQYPCKSMQYWYVITAFHFWGFDIATNFRMWCKCFELELCHIKLARYFTCFHFKRGYIVVQLVEALCYKPEDCGFDSWWNRWDFSLT
jgi:hypothetical protein